LLARYEQKIMNKKFFLACSWNQEQDGEQTRHALQRTLTDPDHGMEVNRKPTLAYGFWSSPTQGPLFESSMFMELTGAENDALKLARKVTDVFQQDCVQLAVTNSDAAEDIQFILTGVDTSHEELFPYLAMRGLKGATLTHDHRLIVNTFQGKESFTRSVVESIPHSELSVSYIRILNVVPELP